MDPTSCIRCRKPTNNLRRYSWASRENEFIDISQIIIDELLQRDKGHTRHWSLDMCVDTERAPFTKMYLYIQMQLCLRETLHDWLRKNRSWDSRGDKVIPLFSQIVSAVEYVHLAGLIHRDLKPSNIMFAPDGKVKVGDFGLVTAINDGSQDGPPDRPVRPNHHHFTHTNQVGTQLYMSPEQLLERPYGYKVDIYSLGLILFELLHPFGTEAERGACLRGVRTGHYPRRFHHHHPREVEVLRLMLSEDPELRPSATGVRARAPLFETTDERWHFTLPNVAAL